MFWTYLRRELRRRVRQAVFIALGPALGIGLVITVLVPSIVVLLGRWNWWPSRLGKPKSAERSAGSAVTKARGR